MKKGLFRYTLILSILLCLRLVYIRIFHVPFFEQVFISTTIGFIISQILVDKILNK